MKLKEWFEKIEANVGNAQTAGEETGACMIPNQNGGPPDCVLMDKATCIGLGFTYIGGDCGV